jgi:hypothetical protein
MTEAVLRDILAEMRAQTQLLRLLCDDKARGGVVDAVREALGAGCFTLRGLLDLAPDEPALAAALGQLVDLRAPGAAIALQRRVKRWPQFEPVGEQRGITVYRLRD